jgi:hypothetical protein
LHVATIRIAVSDFDAEGFEPRNGLCVVFCPPRTIVATVRAT